MTTRQLVLLALAAVLAGGIHAATVDADPPTVHADPYPTTRALLDAAWTQITAADRQALCGAYPADPAIVVAGIVAATDGELVAAAGSRPAAHGAVHAMLQEVCP